MRFSNPSKRMKTVVTSVGHVIDFPGRPHFEGGKPPKDWAAPAGATFKDGLLWVHVPQEAVTDVVAAGMDPETELPETDIKSVPLRPTDPNAVREQVHDAFDKIVGRGEREDFAASGMPHPNAVSKVLGWTIQNAELKDMWTQYQTAKVD